MQKLMGTIVDPDWTIKAKREVPETAKVSVPDSFDAREKWPDCEDVIGLVRDQSDCGSCWAFGTTEAFNDRKCIATDGEFQTPLSTADTTGCCGFLKCSSMGCNGGQVGTPWDWFID